MAVYAPSDLTGQAVVGEIIPSSPWFAGSPEVTQGWGPTDYGGEPEGHGYLHWHAGADVGLDCGSEIWVPLNFNARAIWVDNPSGYGQALRLETANWDIWLGHLQTRLIENGAQLRGGELLALSNNTGNSTGCHLHFEQRPHGGGYGTDVNPSTLLLQGDLSAQATAQVHAAATSQPTNPYNILDPRYAIWEFQHSIESELSSAQRTFLGLGQTALGAGLLAGGLLMVGFGVRGQNLSQFQRAASRTLTRPATRSRPPSQPAPAPTPAQVTRLRGNLQRQEQQRLLGVERQRQARARTRQQQARARELEFRSRRARTRLETARMNQAARPGFIAEEMGRAAAARARRNPSHPYNLERMRERALRSSKPPF